MDELLVKYLLGETTVAEGQSVLRWINAHADNKRYFDHLTIIWTESKGLEHKSKIDETQAWKRFKERVEGHKEETVAVIPFERKRRNSILRIAAMIAFLIIGTFTAYYFTALNNREIVWVSTDKVLIDTLPDGSVITLNKNATLTYTKDFNEKDRKVILTGEAFFNVTPNKQKPFEIKVGEVNVHVVGTSFNIKSDKEETEVIVETGIVQVGLNNNTVKVLPKQKVLVHNDDKVLHVQGNMDELYNYYRTKKFVCNNTPLPQIVEALNNVYDAKITIASNAARNVRMSTTFENMDLNNILKVITETNNLSIVQKNGLIILK